MSEQPLASFFVFSYNQEQFIRDAIKSAFEQTYEPLEIVFSDDCSPDRTFEIIKKETASYRGPHKIILNRNEKNMGLAGNVNRAFEIAHGQFFVMAAGDDISVPIRTAELVRRWQDKTTPVDLVSSFFQDMDVNGKPTVLTENLVKENAVYLPDVKLPVHKWRCGATGACAGFSRKLYDKYGPLDIRVIAEDAIFPFRAWVESGIALIEKPLVKHRTHDGSLYVIHRNINIIKQAESRRLVRRQGTGNTLARVNDWLRTWQISGKVKDNRVEAELKQWIRLLELEWQAYDSGRLGALKAAILSLVHHRGVRVAIRLIYRQVLGRY
ncbi:MAG: glycosyltransferase [Desulfosporosinus sp.]|nr:glycosyltransferase [Desulfosporosinus sp.]